MEKTDNILSFYASHDAAATFIDKKGDLRVFELERFADIRYAMFGSQFQHWSIGVTDQIRKDFVAHIKSNIQSDPDVIVHAGCNQHDLNILREYFPNSRYEDWHGHHISHANGSYFLSPFDDAWIFGKARVFGNAIVSGNAWVFDDAIT